jgi:hypothetical protein
MYKQVHKRDSRSARDHRMATGKRTKGTDRHPRRGVTNSGRLRTKDPRYDSRPVADVAGSSNEPRNSTTNRPVRGYTTETLDQPTHPPPNHSPRTLPGQSKHFIRHSGIALGDDLRKIASNLSSGYLVCNDTIAVDSHAGIDCSLDV